MNTARKYTEKMLNKISSIKHITVESTMKARSIHVPLDRLYALLEKREHDTNKLYAQNERLKAQIRANMQSIVDNTREMDRAYKVIAAISKKEPKSE